MSSMLLGGPAPLSDQELKVKVILGSCQLVFNSDVQCPCDSGSSVIQAHSLSTQGKCDDCGHLLSQHRDYAPSRPGIPTTLCQYISPRSGTVRKLAALLDKKRVVHVRGPPSSGKTTLAHLLELHYAENGQTVKVISGWSHGTDLNSQQNQEPQVEGLRFYLESLLHTNTVFIVDDAQESFSDHALWLGPIKSQSGASGGARICLLSSYGNPTTGLPGYPDGSVPLYLEPSQRVSITEQSDPDSSGICLFYNEEEFHDAVNRLCTRPETTFDMESSARAYLYSVTKGHPGAVEALISYVYRSHEQALNNGAIQAASKEHLSASLHDESRVFRGLRHSAFFRSFPLPNSLTAPAVNALRRALEDGSVPCNLQDEGIRLCYEKGWLHSDLTRTSASEDPSAVCSFPTRIHMKFVEYTLHVSQLKPFPFDRYPCLASLCETILKCFSRTRLLSDPDTSHHLPCKTARPPETPFQEEWYRCFSSLVGHGVGISSKWSPNGNERIDFCILGPAWGVELLRDGDHIHNVCARFQNNGLYHPLIEEGKLTDWLILDCRQSAPQKYHVPGTKLWRVVFKDDFTSAYVLDSDNAVVVPEFILLD